MANELRLRSNNQQGIISDNPLTNVATTINSPSFVDLPVVDATNHLILVLDPLETNGPAEIVQVTAHGAAASSVTAVRGAEGSAARTHVMGTTWFHGPVTTDYTEVLTSSTRPTVPYTGELLYETDTGIYKSFNGSTWVDLAIPIAGSWETWTPTLANLTLGDGTLVAKYSRQGRDIHFRFVFTLGAGSAVGSNPTFTLPVAPASGFGSSSFPISYGKAIDSNGADYALQDAYVSGSTMIIFYYTGDGQTASVTASAPFTWASGDSIVLSGTYEAAS